MKQDIYIFGAGGLGKETVCLLQDLPQYNVVAFVDKDDITRTSVVANGIRFPIISEMAFEKRCMEDRRVCAVTRRKNVWLNLCITMMEFHAFWFPLIWKDM